VLDPPSRLRGGLRAQQVSLRVDELALPLGEELLLGAEPVAAIGGEALALVELRLRLDDLGRPLAELPCFLGEGQRALLDGAERPLERIVGLLLLRSQLLDPGGPLDQLVLESLESLELVLDLVFTERDLGAALVELCGARLQVRLERISKALTKPHAVSIEPVKARKTPLSGGGPLRVSAFRSAWHGHSLPCNRPRGLRNRGPSRCLAAHRARRLSFRLDERRLGCAE
jgi:hypothetical protein